MKKTFYLILLLATGFITTSCSHRTARLSDYTKEVYTPDYASGFEIIGAAGMQSTILRTKTPWQGAENVATMIFIARNDEQVPEGFDGQVIDGEAQRIICMSSTHVAMLNAVDAAPGIVGVSGLDNITNEYVTTHKESIRDVGFDPNVNYEQLVSLDPDLVLLFGVTGASGMESKLQELGVPFAYVGEYLEESPLGKAEWLVAVSELVDKREEGERVFATIPERYNALKERVVTTPAKNPIVMINTPYAGTWFMASTESYVARLIADAGGDYIYTKNTSNRSRPIDLEEAYLLVAGADVWLNVGSVATLGELKTQYPKFADVPCVKNGEVFNCNNRANAAGGNDYWESGVVRPDVILHDLIVILHPEVLAENDREMYYYRRIE